MSKFITVVFNTENWTRTEREELSSREDVHDVAYRNSIEEERRLRELLKKTKDESVLVQIPGGGNAIIVPYWFIQEQT